LNSFALQHKGKCLLGDEMGLGKTVQAIAIACCYSGDWPLLGNTSNDCVDTKVICPSGVRMNWKKELEKWLPELARKGSGRSDINVINTMQDKLK
jgi:SWI/SNF-related matrix-associated actin-dependent regulator 1 of chromatin subfamily A